MPLTPQIAVVPILIGPLQVLLAVLPALLAAAATGLLALLRPRTFLLLLKLLWRQKLPVAIACALVGGGVYLLGMLPAQNAAAAPAQQGEWPMFRGDARRGGACAQAAAPAAGGVVWRFDKSPSVLASPAVAGNRVYFVSAEKGVWNDRGVVYCVDLDSGQLVWQSDEAGLKATFSSPAVSGNRVVLGEGLHDTHGARVSCLDAHTGKLLWQHKTRSHVESSPCVVGERVFIGAGDDGYWCLDLAGDGAGGAKVIWHAPGERYPDAETSPVSDGRSVYVGLGIGGNAVCSLSAADGTELWRTATPYPVFAPPTYISAGAGGAPAGEDILIVAMGSGDFVNSAAKLRQEAVERLKARGASPEQIAAASAELADGGQVWCLRARDGAVLWKLPVAQTVLGAVAFSPDGRLYFGSRDGHVYAASLDGRELARYDTRSPIVSSPAVTGSGVYVTVADGRLLGLALREGAFACFWELDLGPIPPPAVQLSSPAVAGGHVLVGTPHGGLVCAGRPADAREARFAGPDGCTERPPDAAQLLWSAALDAPADACIEGMLGAKLLLSSAGAGELVCMAIEGTGARERWRAAAATPVVGAGTRVYHGGSDLTCRDAADGRILWRRPGRPTALAAAPAGLALARGGEVCLLDPTGQVLWRRPLEADHLAAAGAILLAAGGRDEMTLTALDAATGQTLWQARTGERSAAWLRASGRVVAAGIESSMVAAFDIATGKPAWRRAAMPHEQPGAARVSAGAFIYTTSAGKLMCHQGETP